MILFILKSLLKCQLFLRKSLPFQWNPNLCLIILIKDVDSFEEHEFSSQSLNSVPHFPSLQTKNPSLFFPPHPFPSSSLLTCLFPLQYFLFSSVSRIYRKQTKPAIRTPETREPQAGERTNSPRNPRKLSYTISPTCLGNRAQRYLVLARTRKIDLRSYIRMHLQC